MGADQKGQSQGYQCRRNRKMLLLLLRALALGNAAALSGLTGSTTFGNPFSGRAGFAEIGVCMCEHDAAAATPASATPASSPALDAVEAAVDAALLDAPPLLESLPAGVAREAVGVARVVRGRLDRLARARDCRRCWLQAAHCVCARCAPPAERALGGRAMRRLFVLIHHKEVALAVDTAKLLAIAYPNRCRLVIGALPSAERDAMRASLEAGTGLVLFPSEDARPAECFAVEPPPPERAAAGARAPPPPGGWDVVVVDGTWNQARKLHAKLPRAAPRAKLGAAALARLEASASAGDAGGAGDELDRGGRQLRRHPQAWREIATVEATRLLLDALGEEAAATEPLAAYQRVADAAARRQLGPPRVKPRAVPGARPRAR